MEIEAALSQLSAQEQWEIARWLLEALEEGMGSLRHVSNLLHQKTQ